MKISTYVRNSVITDMLLGSSMSGLEIYSGSMPASGGTAPTGTLLVTFPINSISWNLEPTSAGTYTTADIQTVSNAAVAAGTAGYARLIGADLLTTGDNWAYLTVGTAGTEVVLSSTTVYLGGISSLLVSTITIPG